MTNNTIHPFDAELFQLISDLEGRLSPVTLAQAKEYVEHDEHEICLELIIYNLEEIDLPIPADILNRLIEYSAGVNVDNDICKNLRPE
ncbi:MafI family immunity protein [Rathayibacter toxicus]|uniref:MafI family immunity protein n=1 Tax=Rathayibacter toxicus TaxID=145458 RepID=UPI00040F440E|nr:MafI family immunity protein [Rathayibacter toxicus]